MNYPTILFIGLALLLFHQKPFSPEEKTQFEQSPLRNSSFLKWNKAQNGGAWAKLSWSYLTGEKEKLNKALINQHKQMQLSHLLTPSGLHLSALILLIKFFINPLKRLSPFFFYFFYFSTILTPFYFPKLWACKRMTYFFILHCFNRGLSRPLSLTSIFYGANLYDFLCGQYQNSPLSFCFSFLFFGTIVTGVNKGWVTIVFRLSLNQFLVTGIFNNEYYLLAPIISNVFTIIFGPYFLILLSNLISILTIDTHFLLTAVSKIYFEFFRWAHQILINGPKVSFGRSVLVIPGLLLAYQFFNFNKRVSLRGPS